MVVVPFQSLRILVIDDEAFSRHVVGRILRDLGVGKIIEAEDGLSGLEAYATGFPHAVICDLEMEPMDGLTFLQELRSQQKALRLVAPVIMLTSHGDAPSVKRSRELGAAGYLLKPANSLDLRKRLEAVLADQVSIYGDAQPTIYRHPKHRAPT